jgi:hypothetical protein
MTKRELQVVEAETGETVHTVDVTGSSDRTVEKVTLGMLINMDTGRYFIRDSDDDGPGDAS